jgi:hypothetical protein
MYSEGEARGLTGCRKESKMKRNTVFANITNFKEINAFTSVTRNVTKAQFKAVYGAFRTLCRTRQTFDFTAQEAAEDQLLNLKAKFGNTPYNYAIRAADLARSYLAGLSGAD